jgi:hypothetical protein
MNITQKYLESLVLDSIKTETKRRKLERVKLVQINDGYNKAIEGKKGLNE